VDLLSKAGPSLPQQNTAIAMYSDGGMPSAHTIQHLRQSISDHKNGFLAGTNDFVREIGGQQPTTVQEFITKNRASFL